MEIVDTASGSVKILCTSLTHSQTHLKVTLPCSHRRPELLEIEICIIILYVVVQAGSMVREDYMVVVRVTYAYMLCVHMTVE